MGLSTLTASAMRIQLRHPSAQLDLRDGHNQSLANHLETGGSRGASLIARKREHSTPWCAGVQRVPALGPSGPRGSRGSGERPRESVADGSLQIMPRRSLENQPWQQKRSPRKGDSSKKTNPVRQDNYMCTALPIATAVASAITSDKVGCACIVPITSSKVASRFMARFTTSGRI